MVGGTNLYYKEWAPIGVHKDFIGVLLTGLKCEKSVCLRGKGLGVGFGWQFWAETRV